MKLNKINSKYYLIGIIGCLFLFVFLLIGWCRVADSTHKDLRLRIEKIDAEQFKMNSPYSTGVFFTLKDSLLKEGYSFGKYLVFGVNAEGYDVPLHSSIIPSFIYPSVDGYDYRGGGCEYKNVSNIHKLSQFGSLFEYVVPDSAYFCSIEILKMAQQRNATLCAIVPSYSNSTKNCSVSDMEIDGVLLSQLVKESADSEWVADSLMASIYSDLKNYCGIEHCNVGDNHVRNISKVINKYKRNSLQYVSKNGIRKWLEVNNEAIRTLAKECPDIYNASSQLLDNYHWINQQNYAKVISIFSNNDSNWKYRDNWYYDRDKDEFEQVCKATGYDGDKESIDKFMYTIRFWVVCWEQGDAEWIFNWLKGIM